MTIHGQSAGTDGHRPKRARSWRTGAAIGLLCLGLAACAGLEGNGGGRAEAEPNAVIEWTLLADRLGSGTSNWRTMAIMHRAMHDAMNAARPVYARWSPAAPGEPPGSGALPAAAMAAAAHRVVLLLHPGARIETDQRYRIALARLPDGPAKDAGIRLGEAIGSRSVRDRDNDGSQRSRQFATAEQPGQWRPTPIGFRTGFTEDTRPFLFKSTAEVPAVPPPALDGPVYLRQLDEVRRIGVAQGAQRTNDQSASAVFWANQSSQRGFTHLAGHLQIGYPRPGGLQEDARIMSQLASAFADSGILVWKEKERFGFWRPVTAIRTTGLDPNWTPLVETPPFPEYPSGHAADCFVGAGVLRAAFPDIDRGISYPWWTGTEAPHVEGRPNHHVIPGEPEEPHRAYATLDAAAEDCALSRIWAGVHFRAGDDEAKRLADLIVARAVASVPSLKPR